jgi:protein phosphatase
LNHEISKISSQIYKDYNEQYNGIVCGATLVASVITKDFTVNSSIGDSRIYAVRDNQLQLLTRDESAVWPPNKSAKEITPEELDEIRFLNKSNEIFKYIGQQIEAKEVQTFLINNRSYDKLLLLSDGVTDLLSQDQIRIISRTTPADKLTQALVEAAVSKDAIRAQGSDEFHRGKIAAGKDNATAAMYSRR